MTPLNRKRMGRKTNSTKQRKKTKKKQIENIDKNHKVFIEVDEEDLKLQQVKIKINKQRRKAKYGEKKIKTFFKGLVSKS